MMLDCSVNTTPSIKFNPNCDRTNEVVDPRKTQWSPQEDRRNSTTRPTSSGVSNGSRNGMNEQDDLQFYTQRATRTELLTREKELQLARRIFRYRRAFQRLALREIAVIEHIVEQITKWENGMTRIDGLCELALNNPAVKKFELRLTTHISTLKHLIKRITKVESASELRRLKNKVIRLVEELAIRQRHFESAPIQSRKARWLLSRHHDSCRQLAGANLRLVMSVARKFCGGRPIMMDMIQEGNCGLLRAVTKFDYRRDIRFSTYATLWIRQAIQATLINVNRNIRLPTNYREIDRRLAAAEKNNTNSFELNRIRISRHDTKSLDKPAAGDEEKTFADILQDPGRNNPAETAEICEAIQIVRGGLKKLNEREQQVILLRYGIQDGVSRTLSEVGQHLALTCERIRQIEKLAFAKLSEDFNGVKND